MNSVLQVLWSVPQIAGQYLSAADAIFKSAPPTLANDLLAQVCKPLLTVYFALQVLLLIYLCYLFIMDNSIYLASRLCS